MLSRYNIGLVIVAGLAVGTLFTLFVLTVVYTYISGGHRYHTGELDEDVDEVNEEHAYPSQ